MRDSERVPPEPGDERTQPEAEREGIEQHDDPALIPWRQEYLLWQNEDWLGLLRLRCADAAKNPGDPYARLRLAEAYLLNRCPSEALAILGPLYRRHPWLLDTPDLILEALFALGLDEHDFSWIEPPRVLRLDEETLALCVTYLAPRRRGRDVDDLFLQLMGQGFPAFDEDELTLALEEDPRFQLRPADPPLFGSEVTLAPGWQRLGPDGEGDGGGSSEESDEQEDGEPGYLPSGPPGV